MLFLKHALPFYSLWKVVLFSWMVSPIFLSTIANASALSPNDLSAARLNRDWLEFSESGCGLCYYYYIKPWLDGEFEFFSKFDSLLLLDKLLIISPYFGSIKKFKFFNSQGNDENPFNYSSNSTQNGISNLASKIYDQGSYIFINQFFNSEQPQSQPQHQPLTNEFKREKDVNVGPTVSNETDEEFDFVDKPKVDDVTNRKGKVEGKKGWIW